MPARIGFHRQHPAVPTATRSYERTRTRQADKNFYSSTRWRSLRASFLRSNPLCADCLKDGRITAAAHVHHVQERKDRPDLALEWTNLEPLCPPCHNAKRKADP